MSKRLQAVQASGGAYRRPRCFTSGVCGGALVLTLFAFGLSGCGSRKMNFEEEIQLSNGEVIKVDRSIAAQSFGEIGGPGGWEAAYMSLVIVTPQRSDNPPKWESTAGLVPILFDRDSDSNEWTLLATFFSCEAWYALGRPKPPYAEFRMRDGNWQRVDFSNKWIGRPANVLTDLNSGGEPKLVGLAAKQTRMSDRRIAPEYRGIVENWTTGC